MDWSTTHYCQQQKAVVVLSCFRSPKYEVVDTKVIKNCKALIHGVVGSVCARYVDLGPEVFSWASASLIYLLHWILFEVLQGS